MFRLTVISVILGSIPLGVVDACIADPEQGLLILLEEGSAVPFESSEAVFLGTIVELEQIDVAAFRLRIEVTRWWKGEPREFVIVNADSSGACEAQLRVGNSYVFFPDRVLDGEYSSLMGWASLLRAPILPEAIDAALESASERAE